MHNAFCFAGEAAPCPGYFTNDILPCVCSSKEKLLFELSQVAIPCIPVQDLAPQGANVLSLSA
jgi:hypothetical protein